MTALAEETWDGQRERILLEDYFREVQRFGWARARTLGHKTAAAEKDLAEHRRRLLRARKGLDAVLVDPAKRALVRKARRTALVMLQGDVDHRVCLCGDCGRLPIPTVTAEERRRARFLARSAKAGVA